MTLSLVLILGALICFGMAAFRRDPPRVDLTALGLLLFVLWWLWRLGSSNSLPRL